MASAKHIVKTEEQEKIKLQKSPALLVETIKEVGKSVAGEQDTILSLILIAMTRLVKGVKAESKNFFLSDTTGIGKDFVISNVLDVVLHPKYHLHVSKMSPEAFTYWHANEPEFDWTNYVIHFEDIDSKILNTPTFKTMASGGSFAAVVINQQTIFIPINGKPVMLLTSHHSNPKDEALRRFPIAGMNETIEQTKRIKNKIARKYVDHQTEKPNLVLRSILQKFNSYKILIPFAGIIQHFFPSDVLMRTHFPRFLDYIAASAVFHQHQRKKTKDMELIAEPDDYMIARTVLIFTTSNPKMVPTSKDYRDILKILMKSANPLSVSEIFHFSSKSKDWLYRHLPRLIEHGLIERGSKFDEKANKNVDTYKLVSCLNPNIIPTWQEIHQQCNEILNQNIKNTKNTKKTKLSSIEGNDLQKWFSDVLRKPRKPKSLEKLVFLQLGKPFNREVLRVFLVLGSFLRDKDNKRYNKYYRERGELYDEIRNVQEVIAKNKDAGYKIDYDFLLNNFDEKLISKLIEKKELVKQSNGEYVFGV